MKKFLTSLSGMKFQYIIGNIHLTLGSIIIVSSIIAAIILISLQEIIMGVSVFFLGVILESTIYHFYRMIGFQRKLLKEIEKQNKKMTEREGGI